MGNEKQNRLDYHFVSIFFIILKLWVRSLLSSAYKHTNLLGTVCLKTDNTKFD